jgi:FixJ family two-component response regulator
VGHAVNRPARPRVLVADDQADVLEALRLLLKAGRIRRGDRGLARRRLLAAATPTEFDVALIETSTTPATRPRGGGARPPRRSLQALDPTLPVVVMTAWGSVDVAVEAMRRGARDFVEKPWDNERLLAILRTQVELSGPCGAGSGWRPRTARCASRDRAPT